jgi:hypothetical protein
MKYIVLIIVAIISIKSYGQYEIRDSLNTYYLYKDGKMAYDTTEVLINTDDFTVLTRIKDNKKAIFTRNMYDIIWYDSLLFDYHLLDFEKVGNYRNNKLGISSIDINKTIIDPILDSIGYDDDYEFIILFKGQKKSIIPLDLFYGTPAIVEIYYYSMVEPVVSYFDYRWDDNNAYIFKENDKYGVYAYKYGDTLKIISVIEPIFDSIYIYEDDNCGPIFYVAKDGLVGVFNPDRLDKKKPKAMFSAVYYDEDKGELIKVPSVKAFLDIYPKLDSLKPMFNNQRRTFAFYSHDGVGIYSMVLDTLLIPMIYDSISWHDDYHLEVWKDSYAAYLATKFFDYSFTGFQKNAYLIHEKPVPKNYFHKHTSIKIKLNNDSILLKPDGYGNESIYSKYMTRMYHPVQVKDIIKPMDTPSEQRKMIVDEFIRLDLKYKLKSMEDSCKELELQPLGDIELIVLNGVSKVQLDSLQGIFEEFESYPQLLIRKTIGRNNEYRLANVNFNGITTWVDTIKLQIKYGNKIRKADMIQTTKSGYIIMYNKGKAVVYDNNFKKLFKLKKNQILTQAENNMFVIEDWKVGDSIANYYVFNDKGKEILTKRFYDFNREEGYYQRNHHKIIGLAIEANKEGYNSMYSSNFSSISLETDKERKSYLIKYKVSYYSDPIFYNLKGLQLANEGIVEEGVDYTEHYKKESKGLLLYKTYPRAILYGIHNGYNWIIPMKYDNLELTNAEDQKLDKKFYFYKAGFKNVFTLYSINGERLLPYNIYMLLSYSLKNGQLSLRVIPEGSTMGETIIINVNEY